MRRSFLAVVLGGLAVGSMVLCAVAAAPVGWRTDGSGQYPAADPPTKWSATENVVWKTPMPAWSNATPVIVGEKIFICAEADPDPNKFKAAGGPQLICVNKADGKILWAKGNDYPDVMTPADQAEAKENKPKAGEIQKEIGRLRRESNTAATQLQKLNAQAKTQPDSVDKAGLESFKAKLDDLKKQTAAENEKLVPLLKWEKPSAESNNGYSSATPVSDGQRVWAAFGNGLVACYDLDGNRQWIKWVDRPRDDEGYGFSASPALAGGKLIIQIHDTVALDPASGKELWRQPEARWRWGSPQVTKIGEIEAIVTANGDVVRLADGKMLAKALRPLSYNSPVVVGDMAYFIDMEGGKAFRLTGDGPDAIKTEELWKDSPKNDRYYASPVVYDGLIYDITQGSAFSIIDAKDGKIVLAKTLDLGKGRNYPSIALAGKYLYVSIDNGQTLVLEPGREYKELAKNALEQFRASPVFEGQRLYIRAYKNFYCIGK